MDYFLGDKMVKAASMKSNSVGAFASFKPSESKLFVYLLNKTNKTKETKIRLEWYSVKRISQVWDLKGQNLEDQKPSWSKLDLRRYQKRVFR